MKSEVYLYIARGGHNSRRRAEDRINSHRFEFWRLLLSLSLLSSLTIPSRFSITKRDAFWSWTATSLVARNLRYAAIVMPILLARTSISIFISSGRRTLI